jgi:ubiquinone/menaquinone biosynthesis C-methylase UbiE
MSTSDQAVLAHYERIGAGLDAFLPYLQPVTDAILAHLPILPANTTILDLACGTGEPGLSMAYRTPNVQLLGVDAAESMVTIARRKADQKKLGNARFEVMSFSALPLGAGSVDAVIARFGLLYFGDPLASAFELSRVLKSGGPFSLAVWEKMHANTFLDVAFRTLSQQLKPEQMPPFDKFDALAEPGQREQWLGEAGLSQINSELFSWNYDFPDFETIWELFAGPGMAAALMEPLSETQRADMYQRMTALLALYRKPNGTYCLPETCRLIWGTR